MVRGSETLQLDDSLPLALQERLRFDSFLAELAARLLNVSPEDLDASIQQSLADLALIVGGDRGGISLFSEDGRSLLATHAFAGPGVTSLLFGTDLAVGLPWWTARLREGRTLAFPCLPEGIPEHARAELAVVAAMGMKSSLALPLKAGGELVGSLSVDHITVHRSWSPEFLSRLELLAGVYANALFRRRTQARLQKAHDMNRSVLASVSSEVVVLDRDGCVVAWNEAWEHSARRGAIPEGSVGPGADYLAVCEQALADGLVDERQAVGGIRSVLSGEQQRFQTTYLFGSPSGARRHYLLAVSPLLGSEGVVAVHTDVTELEQAKADLARSLAEVQELKERLEEENVFLHEEIRHSHGFDAIVGTSVALGKVLSQVKHVAPTDATVLLLGETGTGKDLFARAVHDRSRRRARPLVTVNCAALPPALIESELFGYEKGAFTGAQQRTIGRFEVAHGGSILLDEIGELPLEVQAKLLRVLQTGEFERLGSPKTMSVDVRLIAATNRDLEREVREGRFRADLFYRLSVFPIVLPRLRERPEDIPLLVWHFIGRRQATFGKSIKRVPERLMRAFTAYAWPGNVRELENVVERALIMTPGTTLATDPLFQKAPLLSAETATSLAEVERAHICAILDECGWRISGRGNAADRLGLNRSTLQYRMKKLGIDRPRQAREV